MDIIRNCRQTQIENRANDVIRDLELNLIAEEYKHDEFLNVYEILKEQANYPP